MFVICLRLSMVFNNLLDIGLIASAPSYYSQVFIALLQIHPFLLKSPLMELLFFCSMSMILSLLAIILLYFVPLLQTLVLSLYLKIWVNYLILWVETKWKTCNLLLTQTKYTLDLLQRTNMLSVSHVPVKLLAFEMVLLMNFLFQTNMSILVLWCTSVTLTCLDICCTINLVCQFLHAALSLMILLLHVFFAT